MIKLLLKMCVNAEVNVFGTHSMCIYKCMRVCVDKYYDLFLVFVL